MRKKIKAFPVYHGMGTVGGAGENTPERINLPAKNLSGFTAFLVAVLAALCWQADIRSGASAEPAGAAAAVVKTHEDAGKQGKEAGGKHKGSPAPREDWLAVVPETTQQFSGARDYRPSPSPRASVYDTKIISSRVGPVSAGVFLHNNNYFRPSWNSPTGAENGPTGSQAFFYPESFPLPNLLFSVRFRAGECAVIPIFLISAEVSSRAPPKTA